MATVTEVVKESLLGSEHPELPSEESKRLFNLHATHRTPSGDRVMAKDDFINAISPPGTDYHKIQREQYGVLFDVADRRKEGYLTLKEWAAFEFLLVKPDAEYQIAFRLFDVEGTGVVKFNDFVELYKKYKGEDTIPFNWDSDWAALYLGGKNSRHDLTYAQFSQMMRALQGEKARQAFRKFDKQGSGFVEPEDFQRIILETSGHKLSDHVLENLHTLSAIGTGVKVSYASVRAFQNVICEMDTIDTIVRSATTKSSDGRITKSDFLNEAARITRFSHFTPMEADILFHFAGLDSISDRLSWKEFSRVLDPHWREPQEATYTASTGSTPTIASITHGEGFFGQALESAYNFGLGAIAGAFGATVVYPIDLVKTRMQNQRSKVVGEMMYKNSWDCAKKVIRNEGFRGLYSGLGPQLIVRFRCFVGEEDCLLTSQQGVAPEKAIKLTVNDIVRSKATDKYGNITFGWEMIAGGAAGGCQVVFTK